LNLPRCRWHLWFWPF